MNPASPNPNPHSQSQIQSNPLPRADQLPATQLPVAPQVPQAKSQALQESQPNVAQSHPEDLALAVNSTTMEKANDMIQILDSNFSEQNPGHQP
eukprot:CAMPEP_0170490134 /NCGR_PEP_ID=MMETSP0208-20121228/8399_1 /TAXON_ID=197538 /ORGANISM="Strombidium inclinatum, Strain S3" /LENGTH=93 /DNA_ID=CAMNT_0010765391 /DNA_START=170 /DNA_END=451 /DNA_ORIENTATION=+